MLVWHCKYKLYNILEVNSQMGFQQPNINRLKNVETMASALCQNLRERARERASEQERVSNFVSMLNGITILCLNNNNKI